MAMRYYVLLIATILTIGLIAGSTFAFRGQPMMLSGAAHSASPPGTLTCDMGPPFTGTIPAAATQAGFTHCRANYDFAQTQQWTDTQGTHQWSNLSTWLSCAGSQSNPYILIKITGDMPCDTAHQNITTDGGVQILQFTHTAADVAAGQYFFELATEANGDTHIVGSAYYTEIVMKPSTISTCSSGCTFLDISAFDGGPDCFVGMDEEWDNSRTAMPVGMPYIDLNGGVNCTGGSDNSPTGFPNFTGPHTGLDQTVTAGSYGTYGALITQNNIDDFGACSYWTTGAVSSLGAGSFGSCTHSKGPGNGTDMIIPPATTAVFTRPMYFYIENGSPNGGQGGQFWNTTQTVNLQRFTVFTCATPFQCNTNPIITTHP